MARPRATDAAGTDTRQRILEATMGLIARRGSSATRLAAVAAEAGVSLGLVQHFFGTRAGLIRAAFAMGADADLARAEAIAAGPGDGWARLVRLAEYACSDGDDATPEGSWIFWLELSLAARREPELELPTTAGDDAWTALFARVIGAGIDDGSVACDRPAADVAAGLHALTYGLALCGASPGERRGAQALAALGLHPPRAGSPPPTSDRRS